MKHFALLLLLLATGCAVIPVSPRRMVTLEERVATLEKRLDAVESAAPSFSQRLGGPEASDAVASVGTWVPVQAARLSAFGSRSAGGTMSLISGNPVVAGTTITSTWANNTLSDIATEITDSLNRSGKGAMLAALQGYVGTVSLPGFTFAGDTNTGLYWVSADDIGVAVGGARVAEFNASGTTLGATGTPIEDSYADTASLDFAGVTDGCETLTISKTGPVVGDTCTVGTPAALPSTNSWVTCFVSAPNVVSVRHCAHGASGNPAAATYFIRTFDP